MKQTTPRVEIVFDPNKKAKNGKPGFVYIRVYHSREKRELITTGVKISPNEWSDVYHVIGRPDALQLNTIILNCYESVLAKVTAAMQANEEAPQHNALKFNRGEASFFDFIEKEMQSSEMSPGTKHNHKKVYNSLLEHGKIKRFEDVIPANVLDYLQWVKNRTVQRLVNGKPEDVKISQVSVYDYYKILRVYVRKAQEKGHLPMSALLGIRVSKGQSKEREHLSNEEVQKWCETPMPNVHLQNARDRFIVQMGTGLAFADLLTTDFSKRQVIDGIMTLTGRRVKTNTNFFLVILPMAEKVLEGWSWQVPPISNQDYNRYLQQVAALCGIDKHITSHIGRHTYACLSLSKGARLEAVQRTLGHTSIKTTQIYAKLVDMDVVNAFKGIADNSAPSKKKTNKNN